MKITPRVANTMNDAKSKKNKGFPLILISGKLFPLIVLLCEHVMRLMFKFLISIVLFSYSFGVFWLATISPSASSEALRDVSRLLFFSASTLSLISMWIFILVPKYIAHAIKGIFGAFAMLLPFIYIGYPKSLGLAALSSPLMLLSIVFILYQCKYRKSHNKALKSDAERAGAV